MIRSTIHTALAIAVFAALCGPARAAWRLTDLPFREYLGGPVSSLAPAGDTDLWAVSTYAFRYQDDHHVRWNTLGYRSLNAGRLWDMPWDAPSGASPPNSAPFQDTQLYAASFPTRDTGFLFGWRRPSFGLLDPPGPYAFYRTTNRGRTWSIATLPNGAVSAPSEPDFALDTLDEQRAIAAQGRRVFETQDGSAWAERPGEYPRIFALQARGLPAPRVAGTDDGRAVTGTLTPEGFAGDLSAEGIFHAVHFVDADVGWVAGGTETEGVIYGTTDGGQTWTRQAAVPGVLFRGVAGVDASRAWAAGERTGPADSGEHRGVLYQTWDGGATWTLDTSTPGPLAALAFRGPFHGWAGGTDGVYRYVPDPAIPAGDLDGSGQTDRGEVAAILHRAGGLYGARPQDVRAGGPPALTIASAVRALREAMDLRAEPDPSPGARAVVVYNTWSADTNQDGVGDSEEVARHYALRREVPEGHLVAVTWNDAAVFQKSTQPRGNWTDAYHAIVEPLRARIDGIGRENIDTIVFSMGVPYAVWITSPDGTRESAILDSAVQDLYGSDEENWVSENPYGAPFDSVAERYGRLPFVPGGRPLGQPVVDAGGGIARGPLFLSGRLDGPSVDIVKAMIDNAVFAEAHYGPGGYEGVAYIDHRAGHYNYPTLKPYTLDELRAWTPVYESYATFDKSIARSLLAFHDRGHAWRDEVTYASIGTPVGQGTPVFRDGGSARSAPRAMFYAGWYNYGRYYDAWDWLPGSVGIDFDSASAAGFRGDRYFAGGALNAGLSVLVGVLQEPYRYHPKPDALMEYLARGFRVGEAVALANDAPRLGRSIALGDPLYRPFPDRPAAPVPVPALEVAGQPDADGWVVTLTSDIPVRAVLRHEAGGGEPGPDSPAAPSASPFYARRHVYRVPGGDGVRVMAVATDPTGRVTESPVHALP